MFRFYGDFFSNRSYCGQLGTITSSVRQLYCRVPQCSCLSPVLFNIVLATLPLCLFCSLPPSPSCAIIYADDLCLRSSHKTRRTLRPFVQANISRVGYMLADLGFCVSVSKTTVLTCLSRPLRNEFPKLYLYATLLPRVRTCRYLVPTIDSRLTWRRDVTDLLPRFAQVTSIVPRIRGLQWGPSPPALLCVHRSAILYLIPYVVHYFPL